MKSRPASSDSHQWMVVRPSFGSTAQAGVPSTQFLYVSISFRLFGCQHQLVVRKKCPNHSEILQTAMLMLTKKTLRPVWSNELNERSGRSTSVCILRKATLLHMMIFFGMTSAATRGPWDAHGCTRRHGTDWDRTSSPQTSFGSSSHLPPSVWSLHVMIGPVMMVQSLEPLGGHSNLWNHWSCWDNNHWNHSASVSTSKSTSLWTMLGNLAFPLLMHSKDKGRNRHGLGEATQVCVYVYVKSRVYVGLDNYIIKLPNPKLLSYMFGSQINVSLFKLQFGLGQTHYVHLCSLFRWP